MKKYIYWISTGGTFACKETEKGLAPFSDKEFMKKIAEEAENKINTDDITIEVCPLLNKDSTEMNINDCFNMASIMSEAVKTGFYDGIIVTHGTDTMAYSAAMLSVIHKNPQLPIIFTGSQLPFYAENSDAKGNFIDSISAVLSNQLKGVFVVFNGKIYHGLDCYKSDTKAFDAFSAYDKVIGKINQGKTEITDHSRMSKGEYIYNSRNISRVCDKVQLIKLTPLFNEEIIDSYVENGTRGLVIEGYGTGGVPSKVIEKLSSVREKGVLSMIITQCQRGGTDLDVYETNRNLKESGIIDGGKVGAEGALALMMDILSK